MVESAASCKLAYLEPADYRCMDCGKTVTDICEHVLRRATEPTIAFQSKVISEVQEENEQLRDGLKIATAALRRIVNTTAVGPSAAFMSGVAYQALKEIDGRA